MDRYKEDLKAYLKAMTEFDSLDILCAIEKKYDLYGYPPEIVTHALNAASNGEDMYKAVDEYIGA